jgi:hypothetical protein
MNERQAWALAHPLNRADIDQEQIAILTHDRVMRDGNILRVILAVDR